jgi:ribosomal protein L7/L12
MAEPSVEAAGLPDFASSEKTRVVLMSVGVHPHLIVMRLRRVAGVDQAEAIRIINRVPTTVVEHVSLPSAEQAVAALAAAGGHARLELERTWPKTVPSR